MFITADQHFYHKRILKYRPFATVEEMNREMIERWNEIVGKDDVVYVLGDFSLGRAEETIEVAHSLNGSKTLILGNHDRKRTRTFWKRAGFEDVVEKLVIHFMVLSHEPVEELPEGFFNFHGHEHEYNECKTHMCVSADLTDFRPYQLMPHDFLSLKAIHDRAKGEGKLISDMI